MAACILKNYDIVFRVVPTATKPDGITLVEWLKELRPSLMTALRSEEHAGSVRKFLRVENYRRAGEKPPIKVDVSRSGSVQLFSVVPKESTVEELLSAYDDLLAKIGWRVAR